MSLTIETELKDIFTKIDSRLERMEQGINELKLGQSEIKGEVKNLSTELRGEIKNLDEKLGGKINTLDTKVDGLSTRVGSQEFLSRTIVGGLVLIILGGAAKMFWNFPVNP
jgi:chromosome segregation ATPase